MTDATQSTPAVDGFASAPGMTPAPAQAPPAPAGPNPFADATLNLTEQGRLVRHEPERAREFIKAAGKEGQFANFLSAEPSDPVARMRAEVAASPDAEVRRAYDTLHRQKAERDLARGSLMDVATDPDARIAQLEAMRKHNSMVFEAKHADEYKALIEARDAGPQDIRPLDATASRQKIAATDGGQQLLSEWGEQAPAKVQAAQQSTLEMLTAMGDKSAQGVFMYSVSQLPGAVQTGFARELSSAAPEVSSAAADWQIAEYKSYGLVEKWGAETPMRVARAEARAERMIKNLPADNRVAAIEWFRSLPMNQRAAIVEQLSR